MDAIGILTNTACFHQLADGHLVGFFTDTEEFTDRLRVAFVPQRAKAVTALKIFEHLLRQRVDTAIAGFFQHHIDLAVFANLFDEARQALPRTHRAVNILTLQQSHGTVVDDHLVADIGRTYHQQLYQLCLSKLSLWVEMLFQLGGSGNTIGVVQVEKHGDIITGLQRLDLFVERQEQILGQPPVKKGTDLVHFDHLKAGKLTHPGTGAARGGDRLIVGVQIDKYLQQISQTGVLRHFRLGQQNATGTAAVQIDTELDFTNDFKLVELPDFGHVSPGASARLAAQVLIGAAMTIKRHS